MRCSGKNSAAPRRLWLTCQSPFCAILVAVGIDKMDFGAYNYFAGERHGRCGVAATIFLGKGRNAMAVYQPVVGTVQCQVMGRVDGQLTVNDLYFQAAGAITFVSIQGLATALADWVVASLAPLLSDDWASERVIATDLTTATGFRVEQAAVQIGGVSGEANPNNVAAVVSLRSSNRGRSGRGRNYVPGIAGSVVTLNTLDPAFIVNLLDAYLMLMGAGSFLAGWELVVVSRFAAGVRRAAGLAQPVTNILMVGNSVRSMRSREIGHGA